MSHAQCATLDAWRRAKTSPQRTVLRERMKDFSRLADHFLKTKCRQHNRPPMQIPKRVLARWAAEEWKDNLRELANVIERAIILSEGNDIVPESRELHRGKGASAPSTHSGESLAQTLARTEAQVITQVLRDSGWMLARAAARLRIPRSTLRYKMNKLRIKPPKRIR